MRLADIGQDEPGMFAFEHDTVILSPVFLEIEKEWMADLRETDSTRIDEMDLECSCLIIDLKGTNLHTLGD